MRGWLEEHPNHQVPVDLGNLGLAEVSTRLLSIVVNSLAIWLFWPNLPISFSYHSRFPPSKVMKSCNNLPWVVKAIILSIFEEVSPAVAVLKSGVNVWWDPLNIISFIRTFRSTALVLNNFGGFECSMFNVNLPVGYWTRVAGVHWRRPGRLKCS